MNVTEICAGALILLSLAIVVYLLFGRRPFTYSKRAGEKNTDLAITARRNIRKVSLTVKAENEDMTFERGRIKKGQTVDFVYPSSKERAKLTVEDESGKKKAYEI
jgi:hypothetical protein